MLKYTVAGVLLLAGLAASAPPVVAQAYNTESPARIRQEMDRPRAPDANIPAPQEIAKPERAGYPSAAPCADCPPPKHYDNVEVVKTSRDVDQSRVINTEAVVEVPSRERETNKLIVHENETRNVGVVQHNHRIIEKEIRYVKRAPVYRYVPAHRPVQRVQTVMVPVVMPPAASCGCPCTCSGSSHGLYGYVQQQYAYAQQQYANVRQYAPVRRTVQQQYVLVPVDEYGYRYR